MRSALVVLFPLLVYSRLPEVDHHAVYRKDLARRVPTNNITTHPDLTMSDGSYIVAVYTTPNCKADSVYTATGYTLGGCITLENESYMYTDCSSSGGKTMVTLTTCTSTDCSSGCTSIPLLPQETGCQSLSTVTCSSSSSPWDNFDLNYHMEFYWGEKDCDGKYDQWTAINVEDCGDDDWDCTVTDDDEVEDVVVAMKGKCHDDDDN